MVVRLLALFCFSLLVACFDFFFFLVLMFFIFWRKREHEVGKVERLGGHCRS